MPFAELLVLGDTDFVNAHHPGRISPMVYAARAGHTTIILQMIQCKGTPERQGSDWAEFFMAATSIFRRDTAWVIHCMMKVSSLLAVSH